MKKCKSCKQEKSLESYYKHPHTLDGRVGKCKECTKISRDIWREKNPDYSKNWFESKPDYSKKWRENNPDYFKNWKEDNLNYMKEYCSNNRESINKSEKEWRAKNRESFLEWQNSYFKERRKDPLRKLHAFILAGIYRGTKGSKDVTSLEVVGMGSWEEFKLYIESQFEEGMSWSNHGKGVNNTTWHIDHKIPISSAKTLEEVKKLNHYSNLRPMWGSDNIRKSNKMLGD
jgi:hypothetical protein